MKVVFVPPWLRQSKYKIFYFSPYTILIPLSPSPSKLGRKPCWVACLFVSVSAFNFNPVLTFALVIVIPPPLPSVSECVHPSHMTNHESIVSHPQFPRSQGVPSHPLPPPRATIITLVFASEFFFTSMAHVGHNNIASRPQILWKYIQKQQELKVHKHEIFFLTFFAETETLWSQGPVTWDFRKSYSIRPRYSTFKHFRACSVCSACDEISSPYAQCAIKFVLRMLSMDGTCKKVHILPLAEHARKFVPSMLSMRWNRFRVCSACDKIVSAYAQHTHAKIF
jgi:hypothetical protein